MTRRVRARLHRVRRCRHEGCRKRVFRKGLHYCQEHGRARYLAAYGSSEEVKAAQRKEVRLMALMIRRKGKSNYGFLQQLTGDRLVARINSELKMIYGGGYSL